MAFILQSLVLGLHAQGHAYFVGGRAMIRQIIDIPRYHWSVTVFYHVHCYHTNEVLSALREIGCEGDFLDRARDNMESCKLDTGITFSNVFLGKSVIVIAKTSSPQEFANSLAHECQHLIMHIARRYNIDVFDEEICYLAGEIAEKLWNVSKNMIADCGCGRKKIENQIG